MKFLSLVAVCSMMAMSSVAYTAPPEKPAEKSDKEKVNDVFDTKGRKAAFALVKKIGLERVAKKKPLTLQFYIACEDRLFDRLKIRFKGEKPTLYKESWRVEESKPDEVKTFAVKDFAKVLERYSKGVWDIELMD